MSHVHRFQKNRLFSGKIGRPMNFARGSGIYEFIGRHNTRPRDMLDQIDGMIAGMEGRQERYKDLIADNELASGAEA